MTPADILVTTLAAAIVVTAVVAIVAVTIDRVLYRVLGKKRYFEELE